MSKTSAKGADQKNMVEPAYAFLSVTTWLRSLKPWEWIQSVQRKQAWSENGGHFDLSPLQLGLFPSVPQLGPFEVALKRTQVAFQTVLKRVKRTQRAFRTGIEMRIGSFLFHDLK